jgi:hypothetical protein
MLRSFLVFILLATLSAPLLGQTFQTNGVCEKIIEIDTAEYKLNFVKSDLLQSITRVVRTDRKLTIQATSRDFTFTDYFDGEQPITTYKVVGEEAIRNWIWIEEIDLHSARYILINTKTAHIDTLIGPAKIFGNKVVSLEDAYTDSPRRVEIYQIKNDKLVALKKFSLKPCDKLCCVRDIYLKGKTIFLADNWGKEYRAWKAEVL